MKKNQLAVAQAPKKAANAFAGMSDILGAGFGDMMNDSGVQLAVLNLSDIHVKPQIREQFEDESNTMDEMTASIGKHGVFQTVLVRPTPNGPTPYELVAGERRYIGSERAGKQDIPCLIKEMSDTEAADIQLQENIQRKNLTQIEEAKKVQADLDELGSVEAVLEKHSKGRAWLSKILSLLTLPEQAKRLISEKISADMEVIGMVKTIEKINPAVAKELVDNLKETRGKQDARKVAERAKDVVKPSKKQGDKTMSKEQTHAAPGAATIVSFAEAKMNGEASGSTAKRPFPDRDDDEIESGDDLTRRPDPELMPVILARAYGLIFESGSSPKMFLDTLSNQDRADVQSWLESFYDEGLNAENMALGLIQGLRNGTFATEGTGAFAMLAFVQGADAAISSFNVLNILSLVKA